MLFQQKLHAHGFCRFALVASKQTKRKSFSFGKWLKFCCFESAKAKLWLFSLKINQDVQSHYGFLIQFFWESDSSKNPQKFFNQIFDDQKIVGWEQFKATASENDNFDQRSNKNINSDVQHLQLALRNVLFMRYSKSSIRNVFYR